MILSRGYIASHGIRDQAATNPAPLYFWITLLAVLTIAPIIFAGKFPGTWSTVYGAKESISLDVNTIKVWTFLLDIAISTILIFHTGGWKVSPFCAIAFGIPAFAILLQETALKVALYTSVISAVYALGLRFASSFKISDLDRASNKRNKEDVALWVVTVLMLALTTLIGVLTRPST